jgi:hypothetical protein
VCLAVVLGTGFALWGRRAAVSGSGS